MRKAFLFYRSFYDAIESINNHDAKIKMYNAVVDYGLDGVEPEGLSNEQAAIFHLIKSKIDDANVRRANGIKGGRPKK